MNIIEQLVFSLTNNLYRMSDETILKIKNRIEEEIAIRNRQSIKGMPPPTEHEIATMLLDSQIAAIKLYRERTEAGLGGYSLSQIKKLFDAKKEELKAQLKV